MSMAWALLHEEEVSQDILDMAVSLVEDNL
jgi:hypothetical protein